MELSEKTVSAKLMALWKGRDFQGARAYREELLGHGPQWIDLVRSFDALWELENLAETHGLPDRFRPNIWWMRGPYPGNFGDILTPYVLWHAFGVIPRWTTLKEADGFCIGSIAKFSRPGSKMWSTGMPRDNDPLAADATWSAVRGPLSRAAVLAAGGNVPEIYGDGAALLPELYAPHVEKTHRIGIIPHVLQEQQLREGLEKAGQADSVKVISLQAADFADIERVIRDILSCEEVVSTSLHGIIVSHAYGVPCQSARIIAPDEVAEDSFKMRDYKASVGLEDRPIGIPERFDDLTWLGARRCVLPPRQIDAGALRAAFPFDTPARDNAATSAAKADEGSTPQQIAAEAALQTSRAFLQQRMFAEAADSSSDRALQAENGHLVLAHLVALIGQRNLQPIESFAKAVLATNASLNVKLEVVRLLALDGYAEVAAPLLLAHEELQAHRSFVSATKLVIVNLKDAVLARELRLLVRVTGQVNLVAGQLHPAAATFLPQPEQSSWGRLQIVASPATPVHHIDALREEEADFRQKMAAPRQPNVMECHDVFTDNMGQVWKSDGRFIAYRSTPVEDVNPAPSATFDTAFAANRGTKGIYHWIVDYLPMFAWIMDLKLAGKPVPPIFLNAGNGRFERESIEILGLSDHVVTVHSGAPVKVNTLLSSKVGFLGLVGWTHLQSVFGTIIDRSLAIARQNAVDLPERIYISRRAVVRRAMSNEDQVEDQARARDFAIYDFATLPLWHQIALTHHAKVIMSPHGAGLSHIIFAQPRARIVELLPIKDGTYRLRFNYARLSILRDLDYFAWLEPQHPQVSGWDVDLEGFIPFLDSVLAQEFA